MEQTDDIQMHTQNMKAENKARKQVNKIANGQDHGGECEIHKKLSPRNNSCGSVILSTMTFFLQWGSLNLVDRSYRSCIPSAVARVDPDASVVVEVFRAL